MIDLQIRKRPDSKSTAKTPQYNEKLKFSQLINQLSTSQIGKVVEMIQARCPSALNDDDESYLEIEVDNIDKATLAAINSFADQCVSGEQAKKTKK